MPAREPSQRKTFDSTGATSSGSVVLVPLVVERMRERRHVEDGCDAVAHEGGPGAVVVGVG